MGLDWLGFACIQRVVAPAIRWTQTTEANSKYHLKKRNDETFTEKDYQELGAKHHLLHSFVLNLNLPQEGRKHLVSEYFSEDFKEYLKLFGEQALEEAKNITISC